MSRERVARRANAGALGGFDKRDGALHRSGPRWRVPLRERSCGLAGSGLALMPVRATSRRPDPNRHSELPLNQTRGERRADRSDADRGRLTSSASREPRPPSRARAGRSSRRQQGSPSGPPLQVKEAALLTDTPMGVDRRRFTQAGPRAAASRGIPLLRRQGQWQCAANERPGVRQPSMQVRGEPWMTDQRKRPS